MAFKMKNPSMAKMVKAAGDNRAAMKMKMEEKAAAAKMKKEAAMKMKKESAMKMDKESMAKLKEKASAMKMKKSPMEKELVGKQHNLPEDLKAKIEAAPSKMKKSAMKKKKDGDNRSLFQKAKDEGKQILKGIKAGSDALDRNLQSGMQNSESPIAEAKKAYNTKFKGTPIKIQELMDASVDPSICLLPHQIRTKTQTEKTYETDRLAYIVGTTTYPVTTFSKYICVSS